MLTRGLATLGEIRSHLHGGRLLVTTARQQSLQLILRTQGGPVPPLEHGPPHPDRASAIRPLPSGERGRSLRIRVIFEYSHQVLLFTPAMARRADIFVLASRRSRVSLSAGERSANISPIQSTFARAMARTPRRPPGVRGTVGGGPP